VEIPLRHLGSLADPGQLFSAEARYSGLIDVLDPLVGGVFTAVSCLQEAYAIALA
jgi:hypothetical protein